MRALPGLFARNERVIAQFDTAHGRMALVLVGAMNVAAIETVWQGLVTPASMWPASTLPVGRAVRIVVPPAVPVYVPPVPAE